MNTKTLPLLLMLFMFTTNISAQDVNNSITQRIDSLQAQLNKLQHDYDYLYYESQLKELQHDLKILRNEILSSSALISIYVISGEYNNEIYYGLKEQFDTHNTYINVYEQLATEWKKFLPLKMTILNFSEEEKKTMESNLTVIEECVQNAKNALEHQEFLIDKYKNLKWR